MNRTVTTLALIGAIAAPLAACKEQPSSLADAMTCVRAGDLACAAENYEGYLKINPADVQVARMAAIVLTQSGEHQRAIAHYRTAIDGGVREAQMYANYGTSLAALGDKEGAVAANKEALKLNPTLIDVAAATMGHLNDLGRPGEAADVLEAFDANQMKAGANPRFPEMIKILRENQAALAEQAAAAPATAAAPAK